MADVTEKSQEQAVDLDAVADRDSLYDSPDELGSMSEDSWEHASVKQESEGQGLRDQDSESQGSWDQDSVDQYWWQQDSVDGSVAPNAVELDTSAWDKSVQEIIETIDSKNAELAAAEQQVKFLSLNAKELNTLKADLAAMREQVEYLSLNAKGMDTLKAQLVATQQQIETNSEMEYNQLEDAKAELSTAFQLVKERSETLNRQNIENATTKADLSETQRHVKDLHETLTQQKNANTNTKVKLSVTQLHVRDLHDTLTQQKNANANTKVKLSDTQLHIRYLQDALTQQKNENARTKVKLSDTQLDVSDLRETLTQQKNENNTIKADLSATQEQVKQLLSIHSQHETNKQDCTTNPCITPLQIREIRDAIAHQNTENSSTRASLVTIKQQVEQLLASPSASGPSHHQEIPCSTPADALDATAYSDTWHWSEMDTLKAQLSSIRQDFRTRIPTDTSLSTLKASLTAVQQRLTRHAHHVNSTLPSTDQACTQQLPLDSLFSELAEMQTMQSQIRTLNRNIRQLQPITLGQIPSAREDCRQSRARGITLFTCLFTIDSRIRELQGLQEERQLRRKKKNGPPLEPLESLTSEVNDLKIESPFRAEPSPLSSTRPSPRLPPSFSVTPEGYMASMSRLSSQAGYPVSSHTPSRSSDPMAPLSSPASNPVSPHTPHHPRRTSEKRKRHPGLSRYEAYKDASQ